MAASSVEQEGETCTNIRVAWGPSRMRWREVRDVDLNCDYDARD